MNVDFPKNNLKRPTLLIISLFLFVFNSSYAQEGVYWMGISTKNPAAIGTPSDWIIGSYNYASLPYDLEINGFFGSADSRISPQIGSIGVNYMKENLDYEKISLAELCYAYTFSIKEMGELNFGFSMGLNKYEETTFDNSILDQNDPSYMVPDPKAKYLKTGIGTYFISKKLDFGISYNFYKELENNYGGENFSIQFERNVLTALGAYRFFIHNKFTIEPNVLLDFEKGNTDKNLGLFANYNGVVWMGYNNLNFNDTHSVMIGIDIIRKIRVGYSYSFAEIFQEENYGFHEFVLGFRFN